MARGAKLSAKLDWDSIPLIAEAIDLVKQDIFTGASTRNWLGYGHEMSLGTHMNQWQKNLLSDPQTSGGLLVSCSPESTEQVLEILRADGFSQARKIGEFVEGAGVSVA
jgi:selenide,water dikinase